MKNDLLMLPIKIQLYVPGDTSLRTGAFYLSTLTKKLRKLDTIDTSEISAYFSLNWKQKSI